MFLVYPSCTLCRCLYEQLESQWTTFPSRVWDRTLGLLFQVVPLTWSPRAHSSEGKLTWTNLVNRARRKVSLVFPLYHVFFFFCLLHFFPFFTLQHVVRQDGEIRWPFKKIIIIRCNIFIQAPELESFQFMLGINTSHVW